MSIVGKMIEYVKANPGATTADVFEAIPQTTSKASVGNNLSRLAKAGVLENRGGSVNRWNPARWYLLDLDHPTIGARNTDDFDHRQEVRRTRISDPVKRQLIDDIDKARIEQGLSIAQVARRLEWEPRLVSAVLTGSSSHKIGFLRMCKLCEAVGLQLTTKKSSS